MALNFGVLQTANPVNAFFKGQQDVAENAMAQQKMAQEQEMNALRRQQLTGQIQSQEEDRARARRVERTGMFRDRLSRARDPEAARNVVRMQYADPDLAPILSQAATLEQALAEVPDDPNEFRTYLAQETMGMGEWMKSQMPKVAGNAVFLPSENRFITAPREAAPAAPPAMVAEYNFARSPEGGNFRGSYQEFVIAREAAKRPPPTPAQPVAPTITQIVDPANPNRMITVDARRYTGGTVGSPGVLGVGGKEPSAAVRANKAEEGKTQLADDLDNLRASFTRLDEMRAIPSTARGALSNIASATAATGIGQTAGRFVGTEAQVEREVINSARTRLVNSIKNATGMSAQQLNSNVELQTMLKSISDPGQPIEAALRIIDDIENAYVKGAGMSKKKPPAAGGATGGKPTPAATSSGATVSNW